MHHKQTMFYTEYGNIRGDKYNEQIAVYTLYNVNCTYQKVVHEFLLLALLDGSHVQVHCTLDSSSKANNKNTSTTFW